MNSVFFLNTRKKVLFSILAPLLFLIIFGLLFSTYFTSENRSLKERKTVIEAMPNIKQKISMADTIVKRYKIATSKIEVLESLNSHLNQMAQRNNFIIDSLTVEMQARQPLDNKTSIYKVAVKGEGSVATIIDFFNDVYFPDKLFVLEKVKLKMVKLTPEYVYNADFVFSYHCLQ